MVAVLVIIAGVVVWIVVDVMVLEILIELRRWLYWWWLLIVLRVTLLSVEYYDCGRLLVFSFIVVILLKTPIVTLFVMSVKVIARPEI